VECRWQEEDRRKQAAIVTDDSLGSPLPRPSLSPLPHSRILSLSRSLAVRQFDRGHISGALPRLIALFRPPPCASGIVQVPSGPARSPRLSYDHAIRSYLSSSVSSSVRKNVPRCDSNYARGCVRVAHVARNWNKGVPRRTGELGRGSSVTVRSEGNRRCAGS